MRSSQFLHLVRFARSPVVIYDGSYPWQLLLLLFCLLFSPTSHAATFSETETIKFNRDVRPILSDRCFLCHGPDRSSAQAAESGLRLDVREEAVDFGVFDFEDVSASEILARVTSQDPDLQMPPPDSQKQQLAEAEVKLLETWISEGAKYQSHWAYLPPQRPQLLEELLPEELLPEERLPEEQSPEAVSNDNRSIQPIDAFVQRKLQPAGLSAEPPADRQTLIRRVTLDLTGLPPALPDVDAFVNDPRPLYQAFESVVDRLLASDSFGEHMARYWLDAARYADTSGYQYDFEREQWVWRDWVIAAFNNNMPFDQFTVEQMAGDLLENATDQTRLATGFHRNHPITIEGGVIDEEYRTEYVMDRVVTTSTVWLGQTFLCARCHDHKYDPISQESFYEFYAFFNNVPERGFKGFDPQLKVASPLATNKITELENQVKQLEADFAELELPLEQWHQSIQSSDAVWTQPKPLSIKSLGGATATTLEDLSILFSGDNPSKDIYEIELAVTETPVQSIRLEALTDPSLTNSSASRGTNGNFVLTEFEVQISNEKTDNGFKQVKVDAAVADYEQNGFGIARAIDGKTNDNGGWAVDGNSKPENRTAWFELAESMPPGSTLRIRMHFQYGLSHQIGRLRLSLSPQSNPEKLDNWAKTPLDKMTAAQRTAFTTYALRRFGDPRSIGLLDALESARKRLADANTFPATMIMAEMSKPRPTFVLERGEYDQPQSDNPLTANVPAAMGQLGETLPRNRLGLARWLVSPDQPLTARVTVNRYWQQFFGTGLVKTSEDFGSQGEYPSHPELLDWLAVEFMDSGWDVKGILKQIVMSSTYQQSSKVDPAKRALDPDNRLLARGPRIRLDGEMIRDTALAVSGGLDSTLGGPSVYPYHPKGLWLEINNRPGFSSPYPHQDEPEQFYRRSMYSFWKRTVTPPSLATFDAPSREYCIVRRSRTNTPLQAFVMLHDPQLVEAARLLAARMMDEGGDSIAKQIEYGFRLCVTREPTGEELKILVEAFHDKQAQYHDDALAAEKALSVGITKINPQRDLSRLAAMTYVARMLMNLSEFVTKG